jgi:hypothetical protein
MNSKSEMEAEVMVWDCTIHGRALGFAVLSPRAEKGKEYFVGENALLNLLELQFENKLWLLICEFLVNELVFITTWIFRRKSRT